MKKTFLLCFALASVAMVAINSSKVHAMEAPPKIEICPGSPESCKGTVSVPGVGTVTVESTKTKGGGTVVVS